MLLTLNIYSQEPTDCSSSVVVCGNSNVNLDVSGIGVQELNDSNTCSSQETNSIWLKVSVVSAGTLGFTLTPTSTSITEDYDFFVFGPNVSCGNIGQAIRCSTTNPAAAGQSNNLTGMNGTANDTAEGPGVDGNSFVRWLDARVGDTYFIVIDRPIGNSSFSLEWTGTAQFSDPPVNQVSVGTTIDLESCDVTAPFDDGLTEFNLDANTNSIIGSQTNVSVSYHLNESDANINANSLPTNYINTESPQNIYYRITNDTTECFDIGSFELRTSLGPDFYDIGVYSQCDDIVDGSDANGRTSFDLGAIKSDFVDDSELPNVNITFHPTSEDAVNSVRALSEVYRNSIPNQEELFVRIEDRQNPDCNSITSLSLMINPLPSATNPELIQCDEDGSANGITQFNLLEIEGSIIDNAPNVEVTYFRSISDAESNTNPINPENFQNSQNPQQIYAKVTDITTGCFRTSSIDLEVSLTSTRNTGRE